MQKGWYKLIAFDCEMLILVFLLILMSRLGVFDWPILTRKLGNSAIAVTPLGSRKKISLPASGDAENKTHSQWPQGLGLNYEFFEFM